MCLLFGVCYLVVFVVRCPSLVARCSLFVVCCLLFWGCCMMSVVLLFVVCCLSVFDVVECVLLVACVS